MKVFSHAETNRTWEESGRVVSGWQDLSKSAYGKKKVLKQEQMCRVEGTKSWDVGILARAQDKRSRRISWGVSRNTAVWVPGISSVNPGPGSKRPQVFRMKMAVRNSAAFDWWWILKGIGKLVPETQVSTTVLAELFLTSCMRKRVAEWGIFPPPPLQLSLVMIWNGKTWNPLVCGRKLWNSRCWHWTVIHTNRVLCSCTMFHLQHQVQSLAIVSLVPSWLVGVCWVALCHPRRHLDGHFVIHTRSSSTAIFSDI